MEAVGGAKAVQLPGEGQGQEGTEHVAAGDIVVLDNLGSHKSQPVRAAIRGPQERSPSALPAALQPRS